MLELVLAAMVLISVTDRPTPSQPSQAFSFSLMGSSYKVFYECDLGINSHETAVNAKAAHKYLEVGFHAAIEAHAVRFGALITQEPTATTIAAMQDTNAWGEELRRDVLRRVSDTYGCRVVDYRI